MDIQIKSSRAVLATDSAVKKLVELKSEETVEDSFLRMGVKPCLLYTSPSPRDQRGSRMPSSA